MKFCQKTCQSIFWIKWINNLPPPLSQRIDLQQYAQKISKCGHFLILGDFEGMVLWYVNEHDKTVYVPFVWIDETIRSHGYSYLMLKLLHEYLKISGYRSIGLEVYKDNTVALSLYSKMGYRLKEDRNEKILMETIL